MDDATKHKWSGLLADTIQRLQDAQKQLDRDDVDACRGYIEHGFEKLRELQGDAEFYGLDDNWNEEWANHWFHEANLFSAFADALSREPFMVEGAYKWRVREITKPPLKMPPDYKDNAKGPTGEIIVGTNTSDVCFTVTFDSTYNKHARGSTS